MGSNVSSAERSATAAHIAQYFVPGHYIPALHNPEHHRAPVEDRAVSQEDRDLDLAMRKGTPEFDPVTAKLPVQTVYKIEMFWFNNLGATKYKKLSRSDFRHHLPKFIQEIPELTALSNPEFAEWMFTCLDINQNGELTFSEVFNGLACLSLGDMKSKATLMFHAYDKDHSGSLSREELMSAWNNGLWVANRLLAASVKSTPPPYADVMKHSTVGSAIIGKFFQADTDRNGFLSQAEWVANCEKIPEMAIFLKFMTGDHMEEGEQRLLDALKEPTKTTATATPTATATATPTTKKPSS
eukprot:TRINITY_DN1350_c0_g2_i5.p1 TRINITY_DN1350_c0_g2~~TRINITY_DN1350_c0_g2_i5.p1  ORF type:complete len:339 (-),score=77.34 TRINITY_DN1350_c0_g2_i5:90-983(-)